MTSAAVFSTPSEMRDTLRWVAIISGKINQLNISASTGVHDSEAVIKQLLAGATTVQLCSTVYKNGPEIITQIINELSYWMDTQSFKSIDEFRGKMNYKNIENPSLYERAQFMKYFSSME